jgi:hypothetical protein
MDTIPNEIVDAIIGRIQRRRADIKLAQYACISRQWQANVEKRTFESFSLITPRHLETFEALFAGSNISRLRSLKRLSIRFLLSSPEYPGCCDVQRVPNRAEDGDSFSTSIEGVFSLLSRLEKRTSEHPRLRLTFASAFRKYLQRPRYGGDAAPCVAEKYSDRHDLRVVQEARGRFGKFELNSKVHIPASGIVTNFHYLGLEGLHLTSISHILCSLPAAEEILYRLHDKYSWGRLQRDETRHGMSNLHCPSYNLTEFLQNF